MGLAQIAQRKVLGAQRQTIRQLCHGFILAAGAVLRLCGVIRLNRRRRRFGAIILRHDAAFLTALGIVWILGSLIGPRSFRDVILCHILYRGIVHRVIRRILAVTQQIDQQRRHDDDQNNQRRGDQAELTATMGRPFSAVDIAANLLAFQQRLLFLTEGAVAIGFRIFLAADRAAFHSHNRTSTCSKYTLHNIGFSHIRQDYGPDFHRIPQNFKKFRP